MCSSNQGTLNPNPISETLHSTPQAYSPRWEGSATVSSALEVDKGTEIAHLGSALWSGERLRVWASSQNLKRAATIYRFSAVKIFEEREFSKNENLWPHVSDFGRVPIPDGARPTIRRFLNA